jgi:hypothetical protein
MATRASRTRPKDYYFAQFAHLGRQRCVLNIIDCALKGEPATRCQVMQKDCSACRRDPSSNQGRPIIQRRTHDETTKTRSGYAGTRGSDHRLNRARSRSLPTSPNPTTYTEIHSAAFQDSGQHLWRFALSWSTSIQMGTSNPIMFSRETMASSLCYPRLTDLESVRKETVCSLSSDKQAGVRTLPFFNLPTQVLLDWLGLITDSLPKEGGKGQGFLVYSAHGRSTFQYLPETHQRLLVLKQMGRQGETLLRVVVANKGDLANGRGRYRVVRVPGLLSLWPSPHTAHASSPAGQIEGILTP